MKLRECLLVRMLKRYRAYREKKKADAERCATCACSKSVSNNVPCYGECVDGSCYEPCDKIFCTEINNYCRCNMNCNFCREERERWKLPKTAEGERLDIMAELVGTARNGRTDEELREAIVNELDKVNKRKE